MPAPSAARWAAALALLASCGTRDDSPVSPELALERFQIAEGFRIERFASEPHVVDPVEMAFDEFGGIYVAELRDNPEDPPEGERPLSRIKYLEDRDADGVIDHHVVFADGLLAVEGIAPWKGGLIATAAPDILYLKDLDGDRRADVREVLYTGFALGHVEGRLSNPRLGLDNWFYVVNNSYPGRVTAPGRPDIPPVSVRNREFRFHPLQGLAEASTGDAQFGQSYNQWGHWFISHNTVHLRHTVIPPGYLRRNPLLTVENAEQDISDHGRPAAPVFPASRPQQWRIDRTAARQTRYDKTQPGRVERLEGFFTASSGATVYLGDSFPAEFRGTAFVGEGAGNLVHCDFLAPSGPTYAASRWPLASEFLASSDPWFRPVNFSNAPDGNLYVLDYYRQYLEHPDFIPEAVKSRLDMDFRAGETMGRIYRIVPDRPSRPRSLRVDLGSASVQELVELLGHPNGWHRRTAHRLLVERQDVGALARLRILARRAEDPRTRLHALWVLEGLEALDTDILRAALADAHPAVRESALRLAEDRASPLSDLVVAATRDPVPRVVLQAALSVGNLPQSNRAVNALAAVLARFPEDQWFRIAVLSAPPEFARPVLDRLLRSDAAVFDTVSDSKRDLLRGFARVIGARHRPAEIDRLLRQVAGDRPHLRPEFRAAVLEGVADGLALRPGSRISAPGAVRSLRVLLGDRSAVVRHAATGVAPHFEIGSLARDAAADAVDEQLPLERRLGAIRVLQGGSFDQVREVLGRVLCSSAESELRVAAAKSLASFQGPTVSSALLGGWGRYPAAVRDAVAELLVRRRDLALALAAGVAAGRIDAQDIPAVSRIRLANHPDEEVRTLAAGRLALGSGDRDRAVAAHLGALDLPADPDSGKAAFDRECSACHLRRGSRGRIGPDLSGVSNRSKESLLTSILDPSRSIEDRYRNHLLTTHDGRFQDGILIAETAATVTLRGEARDITVLKSDVAELRPSNVSLMPEGIEDALTVQELADLIAYLRAGL